MPTITVFTPTYNRANLLPRLYRSLCNQTSNDFQWLIVDDGSTDETESVVKRWQAENIVPIKYIRKENGGLHTGYNVAFANIDTELSVCIDSDDFMPVNAIEVILAEWDKVPDKEAVAGMIGLDADMEGNPIGGHFAKTGTMHIYELEQFHRGDVKIVNRMAVFSKLPPMPSYGTEKNFNPIYFYLIADVGYRFEVINEVLCNVDYQAEGMSAAIFNQFRNSPLSFAEMRRLQLTLPYYGFKRQVRYSAHYISSCIFAKRWHQIFKSPKIGITLLSLPIGIALNLYIRYRTR